MDKANSDSSIQYTWTIELTYIPFPHDPPQFYSHQVRKHFDIAFTFGISFSNSFCRVFEPFPSTCRWFLAALLCGAENTVERRKHRSSNISTLEKRFCISKDEKIWKISLSSKEKTNRITSWDELRLDYWPVSKSRLFRLKRKYSSSKHGCWGIPHFIFWGCCWIIFV